MVRLKCYLAEVTAYILLVQSGTTSSCTVKCMNGRHTLSHTYICDVHTHTHTYIRVYIHNAPLYCMCVHSALTYFFPTQLDSRLRICVGSKKKLHFFHYDKRNRTMLPSPVRMLPSCTHAHTHTHTHTHKHSYTHAQAHIYTYTRTQIQYVHTYPHST